MSLNKDDEEIDVSEFIKKISKNRFKLYGTYKFDRVLFNIAMFGIFGFLFFIAYSNNFELDYYNCQLPLTEDCYNPFYEPVSWKNSEVLPPGEYGTKPGALFNNAGIIAASIIMLTLVINHFIHNKKWRPTDGK